MRGKTESETLGLHGSRKDIMVTIKDFQMPDSCLRCPFLIKAIDCPTCRLHKALGGSYNTTWDYLDQRAGWCPLEEVKDQTVKDVVYGFANLNNGDQCRVYDGIIKLAERNPLLRQYDSNG